MPKALSYADAVRILGGGTPDKLVTALDRLAGGALLALSATGSTLALSLFDAKSEFFRLTGELVSKLTTRLRDTGRRERGEQLAAAHSVIVVAAFFEALSTVRLPFDVAELEFTPSDGLTVALLRTPAPVLAPHRPYERSMEELTGFYADTARVVLEFLTGLSVWDRLDDRDRRAVEDVILGETATRALTRYEDLFRRLATDFPEVGFWANLVDHQATRAEIRELRTGLAGVAEVLSEVASGRAPDDRRRTLARFHEAVLHRSLLPVTPDGVRMPTVAEAYVNPRFRVVADVAHDHIADEDWWLRQPVRADLQEFLVGHLTSPAATEAPLVVLGQPGSGKSMLTKVLAARLPVSEFVAVQVPLREVRVDGDVQTQIEQGLRISTGERLSWRDFVQATDDAVPVVLLDGFDELLQATDISQSDYLHRIARFQQREADLGHPVVVVVTSRVSVADRARPAGGMVSLLLEPFDDEQIERWLVPWRRHNDTDLTVDVLRPHADLARQPLLLLLLAIYDRTESPLKEHRDALGQSQLYEGLLTGFARREVLKQHVGESDDEVARLVERELLRLSVAAFAMFNRGRQWVTPEGLDADLAALPVGEISSRVIIGSFYFIHTAQALKEDGRRLRTYEFLHPTFGEYLIARITVRELLALAEGRRENDDFFHALLSFEPLTMRKTVLGFLRGLVLELPARCLRPVQETLLSLFHTALLERNSSLAGYRPGSVQVPKRCAVYSANLCVLLVTGPSSEVTTDQLFPDAEKPVTAWARMSALWISQLPSEGRQGLVRAFRLERFWQDGRRGVRITGEFGDPSERRPAADPYWTYRIAPDDQSTGERSFYGWIRLDFDALESELEFLCSVEGDTVAHTLAPFADGYGTMVTTFYGFGDARPVSPAHFLIDLWLKDGSGAGEGELAAAFHLCLRHAVDGFAPFDSETRRKFRVLFLRQFHRLRDRLPSSMVDSAVEEILRTTGPEIMEREDFLALTREICPGLLP
ncbi:hypothetical protein GCM10027598_45660 [Amycolatopsis oliviviridis]|uniref:NACHT N-terminal Helical domain-containing protein n=1 Tax=Amycolatopsis oliviviridis TaxID=1471590 RepID=A0ABQ3L8Q2_9PSEU|nr:hypothetical protein [Amycolatopsis oliviviridis]GHH08855.1 hypothetical protein GCM10017790_16170 [Amycolatopsis oliviviridis]